MRFEQSDTDQELRLLFLLPSQIADFRGGMCPFGSWCPELARPRTPEPAFCLRLSLGTSAGKAAGWSKFEARLARRLPESQSSITQGIPRDDAIVFFVVPEQGFIR